MKLAYFENIRAYRMPWHEVTKDEVRALIAKVDSKLVKWLISKEQGGDDWMQEKIDSSIEYREHLIKTLRSVK